MEQNGKEFAWFEERFGKTWTHCVFLLLSVFIVPAHTNPSCEAAVKAVRARAQQSAVEVSVCVRVSVCSMYMEMYMYVSMYLYIIYRRAIE